MMELRDVLNKPVVATCIPSFFNCKPSTHEFDSKLRICSTNGSFGSLIVTNIPVETREYDVHRPDG